ncbi:ROK family protein [Nonomuraea pusilla]|uniref:Glucokinase n=1 Tax=Nonomuraea pusilla TaxID=46177 RepID=A0A1H7NHV8_9ACTN|nr:ROK family protein [Nonomuraea pusilla]SEL22899.1 glucokinase [Nonomuraea pusilla]
MTPLALAVDIGGTKIAAALVDGEGRLAERRRVPTPASEGGEAIMAAVAAVSAPLLAAGGSRVVACGIGTAGVVDGRGRVASATDLLTGWAGTDVKGVAERTLGLPAVVMNDCHAAGAGESRLGAARDAETALVVAVGTGIGGALCRSGAPVTGRTGTAGSIGHVPAPPPPALPHGPAPAPRRCSCGATDHVEAYASGPAVERAYREAAGRALPLAEIGRRAAAGDADAERVIGDAATLLGRVLAGAANLLDPDVIVIAGGVSLLGPPLLAPLASAFRAEALPGPRDIPVRAAALGGDAVLVGAGTHALARGR